MFCRPRLWFVYRNICDILHARRDTLRSYSKSSFHLPDFPAGLIILFSNSLASNTVFVEIAMFKLSC